MPVDAVKPMDGFFYLFILHTSHSSPHSKPSPESLYLSLVGHSVSSCSKGQPVHFLACVLVGVFFLFVLFIFETISWYELERP